MHMLNENTPYSNLSPHLILEAIETIGLRCSGSLLALNSYENRVYQVGIDDSEPVIAKFYRPMRWSDAAIQEEHHFSKELADLEIPIVNPLIFNENTLHHYQNYRFALFPRRGGRTVEVDNLDHLEWLGRYLGRIHAVGSCKNFVERIQLDTETYGHKPFQFLLENNFIPQHILRQYETVMKNVLSCLEKNFKQHEFLKYIRLHGDCHPGNVLWNQNGPNIVDLDDCLMGPAIQDIWMLLSGDHPHEIRLQLDTILNGYEEFCDFNYSEIRLIESLRTLRMIHYSAWLARRWNDPAFPLNFPWFNTPRYWEEQLHLFNDQLSKLNEEQNL